MTPKGAITQFTQSRFGSYNSGTDIISGPDGALWFTANCIENEGAVGPCFVTQQVLLVRSTTAGAFSIFASAGDTLKGTFQSGLVFASSTSIAETVGLGETRGSNGSAYQLTRTDGTVVVPATALPIGCPDFFPGLFYTAGGIAIGSDNAAYISASSPCGDLDAPNGEAESVVLRLSLSGAVMNTFKVPNAQRIVKGVDGNLWVTQNGAANSIGRLTPSGTLTEFPLPTSRAGPLGITLGNDGAVWFTEFDANKIGRITTDGTITEFPIPTPNAKPVGIASLAGECGPGHGDIWFTEFNANKIGRLLF